MQMARLSSEEVLRGLAWSPDNHKIDCTSALIGRMSHKILGPKVVSFANHDAHRNSNAPVYKPSLAKKTLGRNERTLYERLHDSEDMPLPYLCNEDVNEAAFMSPKAALDEYLFENVPGFPSRGSIKTSALQDATMQLDQERHRREVCSSKLQEMEMELQEFAEVFGTKLVELKKSMGEFAQSMRELMHYDEGNYIEDRLWEEANTNCKAVDTLTSSESPPDR